jgi:hypothetical protein
MIKKIDFGKTNHSDLHQIFKLNSTEELEKKKARLFPSGNTETEVPTTSIFLASLCAVKEYREALLVALGVNKIRTRNVCLYAYTELENNSKEERPDGLLIITSGKHNPIIEWAAFIEAKVGNNLVDENQIARYIEFGKEIGVNTIISVSNEMVTSPIDSPVSTNKRSFTLNHWSWKYLSVVAKKLIRDDAVEDEDHIFILHELRRYIDNHKNLRSHNHMGAGWKPAVTKIHSYEPNGKIDKETLATIVTSFKQEEKDISLELTDNSDYLVELLANEDRSPLIENMLQEKKVVSTPFIINKNKANLFHLEVDFIRHEVRCNTSFTIDKGKAQAQTSALLKMLDKSGVGASDHIFIKAVYIRKKSVPEEITLRQLLDEREKNEPYSIIDKAFGDEIKVFEIKTKDLLGRDFVGPQGFILKVEEITLRFLQQVMSSLTQ